MEFRWKSADILYQFCVKSIGLYRGRLKSRMVELIELRAALRQIRTLRFEATSEMPNGWNGVGSGVVEVAEPSDRVLVFSESGTWSPKSDASREIRFTNTFQWSVLEEVIRLEHLRLGPNNPVYLFDLVRTGDGKWREQSPHICREDCYTAVLTVVQGQVHVSWSIIGPKKHESIAYMYW